MMECLYYDGKIVIDNPKDFKLSHTFDCGQCFRFNKVCDGVYEGVVFKKPVIFVDKGNQIEILNTKEEEIPLFIEFLDLKRDYEVIKQELYKDDVIRNAIDFGTGIRILKQDFFECLISFIISQQNNIPKIKNAVEKFSYMFGKKIQYNGKDYYSFPDAVDLKGITKKDLEPLKIGYRDEYIIDGINKVVNNEISYEKLNDLDYEDAKNELLKIRGVGNKVADCVLLFSLLKFESFPVDTWIKKAMESLYGISEKEIKNYSEINFKEYSGFAQQYIFYYIRERKGIR